MKYGKWSWNYASRQQVSQNFSSEMQSMLGQNWASLSTVPMQFRYDWDIENIILIKLFVSDFFMAGLLPTAGIQNWLQIIDKLSNIWWYIIILSGKHIIVNIKLLLSAAIKIYRYALFISYL